MKTIRTIILGLCFTFLWHTGTAQQTYTYNFSDVLLLDAILQVEEDAGIRFYFAKEWVDTLRISRTISSPDLNEALNQLFRNTKIYFYIYPDRVILTYNSPIITQKEDPLTDEEQELTYVYSMEYLQATDDQEGRTIEIGDKAYLSIGGETTLAGYIREKETGAPVEGAVIYIPNSSYAAIADRDGFYSISLPRGLNRLQVQFTGMKTASRRVMLYSEGSLNIELIPDVIMLEDVLLQADRDENILGLNMGVDRFDIREMKNVPKILGENDIVQIALSMPGVQNVGEGSGGINVRGGKVDQNLMMLNLATIYNPFHLFGFFSSFNADVISEGELYKSTIPVQFGGRLSSVFDVKIKEGSKEKFSGQGGISPVTTHLALEVPLIENKTSLIAGLRTTYSDWVLNFVDEGNIKNSSPFYIDAVIGIDHEINEKNKLQAMAYWSRDRYKLSTDSLYSYNNLATSVSWNSTISDRLLATVTGTFSTYNFGIDYDLFAESEFEYAFDIKDIGIKADLEYDLNEKHILSFGAESRYYQLDPGQILPKSDSSEIRPETLQEEAGLESAIYVSDEWRITDRLSVSAGLRYSFYNALGPREIYDYNDGFPKNSVTIEDTLYVGNGSFKEYGGPEYRFSARYSLSNVNSIKLSLNRTRQYIHILSNNISVAPTNTWKLSDTYIRPQIADQVSVGYFHNLLGEDIETSLEAYYKRFHNLLDYKTGADLVLNPLIEGDVLQGDGFAFGIEFLLKRKKGRLNGWMSYTYSRSKQKFESEFPEETINDGAYFPTNYDKPHVFNMVANFKFTRRYSFSMNVNYSTGRPITYPIGKYELAGTEIVQYSERNQYRIPDYFRIDVGLNIEGSHKIKKLAHSFWTLSVYNVLGRDNVYSMYFIPQEGRIQGYQLSIFSVPIPTITYNFRF